MKTAEEVAGGLILKQAALHWGCFKLQDEIAQALISFAEERVKEDRDKRTADDLYKHSHEMGCKEGRNGALEEVAKLLEVKSVEHPNFRVQEYLENQRKSFVYLIRALKEKP